MPDLGCYLGSFDSSGIETACLPAGTIGHREVVMPPLFIHSCLPGMVAMLRESSGSMSVICIAMCAPLRINNTEPDEARDGAEPYSCPEMPLGVGVVGPVARATGPGERCLHLWIMAAGDPPTPPIPEMNAYGLCIDFTEYTWDHDQDASTPPVPWTLPETTTPCADIADPTTWQPTEDCFWGAAPLPIPLAPSTGGRPFDLGLRLLE